MVIGCTGTGQDGDIQAGAPLSYTDNGDGTITDNNTALMWEKKSNDGSIHDMGDTYTWYEAFAFVAELNEGAGFAGHKDWRLPNVRELQSLVNYEHFPLALSDAFNTGCTAGCTVQTCSCTLPFSSYWSSTSHAGNPDFAWKVFYFPGSVHSDTKIFVYSPVRAVRGGL
jgi:hypothetical protein